MSRTGRAALSRVKAEERERIAQAIEAEIQRFGRTEPGDPIRAGLIEGYRHGARIARDGDAADTHEVWQ